MSFSHCQLCLKGTSLCTPSSWIHTCTSLGRMRPASPTYGSLSTWTGAACLAPCSLRRPGCGTAETASGRIFTSTAPARPASRLLKGWRERLSAEGEVWSLKVIIDCRGLINCCISTFKCHLLQTPLSSKWHPYLLFYFSSLEIKWSREEAQRGSSERAHSSMMVKVQYNFLYLWFSVLFYPSTHFLCLIFHSMDFHIWPIID